MVNDGLLQVFYQEIILPLMASYLTNQTKNIYKQINNKSTIDSLIEDETSRLISKIESYKVSKRLKFENQKAKNI